MEDNEIIKILLEVKSDVSRINGKLDSYNGLREKVDTIDTKATETDARAKSNTHRINKLEESNTWLWRTVASTFIAAGIAARAIFK
ncbi:hypothetical protein JCM15765_33200 [Paradesulfitobacterium aromaticivorans]